MKTKLLALASAATIFLTPALGLASVSAHACERLPGVVIAVEEGFDNLDILTISEPNSSSDWIFTMLYDRLLYIDSSGELQPELAESWEFVDVGSIMRKTMPPFHVADIPTGVYEWGDFNQWAPYTGPESTYFLTGPGPLVIQFNLRDDVYFQNNELLTAPKIGDLITYAQAQPEHTLIYKLWEPVVSYFVVDDTMIQLQLSFPDNYGFIDFLYELASPMAGIAYVDLDAEENFMPVGTGAFKFRCHKYINTEDIQADSIMLKRWSDWWGVDRSAAWEEHVGNAETSGAKRVTFLYVPDLEESQYLLEKNLVDIAMVDSSSFPIYDGSEFILNSVTANPYALMFNKQSNNPLMSSETVRMALDYMFNADLLLQYDKSLVDHSNDIWKFGVRHAVDIIWGGVMNDLKQEEIAYGAVTVLTVDDPILMSLANIAIAILSDLNEFFKELGVKIEINLYVADEAMFETLWETGLYDVKLFEIDLYDIQSAYNVLYGCGDMFIEDDVICSQFAANTGTYWWVNDNVQRFCQDDAMLSVKGWGTKVFAQKGSVSGFALPRGKCPTGDLHRLDFRWVQVNNSNNH